MSPPVLSIEDLYVKVAWSSPFANYEEITTFRVLLEDKNGDFNEVIELCNGALEDNFTNELCLIPMTSFI